MYSHVWHYIGPMYSQLCQRRAYIPGLSGLISLDGAHGASVDAVSGVLICTALLRLYVHKIMLLLMEARVARVRRVHPHPSGLYLYLIRSRRILSFSVHFTVFRAY